MVFLPHLCKADGSLRQFQAAGCLNLKFSKIQLSVSPMFEGGKNRSIGPASKIPTSPGTPEGQAYIVAIGIDRYLHFKGLNNAVRDVDDIVQVLISNYQFEPETVVMLLNGDATRSNIHRVLNEISEKITPLDSLLLYYSGHGEMIKKKGYWIPADGRPQDTASYVSNIEIIDFIRGINSLHTLLISDSCFSGSLFTGLEKGGSATDQLEDRPSRYGMTSGIDKVPDGETGQNSPFAERLLLELKNNTRARLAVTQLYLNMLPYFKSNESQLPQCDSLKLTNHAGGMFMFRLKDAAPPPPPPPPPDIGVKEPVLPTQPVIPVPTKMENSEAILETKERDEERPEKMHWMAWVAILTITISLVWFGVVKSPGSQSLPGGSEMEQDSTGGIETLDTDKAATIILNDSAIYLHAIKTGTARKFKFTVTNRGSTPVDVDVAAPQCSFIVIRSEPRFSCSPGKSKEVEAEWRAGQAATEKTCAMEVRYDNGRRSVRLPVTAQTVAASPAPVVAIRVSPAAQYVGEIVKGKTAAFNFVIENTGNRPAKITSITADNGHVTIQEQKITITPGESKTVNARWYAGDTYGQQKCAIAIYTSGLAYSHSIEATAKVLEPLLPPPPPPCTVRFNTGGRSGIKIWFDEYGGEAAAKTSSDKALTLDFRLPGEALHRQVTIQYVFEGKQIPRTVFIQDTLFSPSIPQALFNQ